MFLYLITKRFELTQQKALLRYDCSAKAFILLKIIIQAEMQSSYIHSEKQGEGCENAGNAVNSVCLHFAFSRFGE